MSELNQYFKFKCYKGLKERDLENRSEYIERLEYEIEVITRMSLCGYLLIVQDFYDWARKNGIAVGYGRGSSAGSLVCYCLKITGLDPIRWNLLFERFLSPDRAHGMCDVDCDFSKRNRNKVIEYVTEKYGADKVAHIGTFNKMRARAAIRSVQRTKGYPYIVGDTLSKLLLPDIHGKPQPLSTSIKKVPEIRAYNAGGGIHADTLHWAQKIEDLISSAGVHAAGIVISNEPLVETVPLFLGRSGETTAQWDMENIEEVGLIKFDFLGLDALDKIHICLELIKETTGDNIDLDNLDLEDELTFSRLREGDTNSIFQLEASSGIRDILVQVQPTCLEDISVVVACYRPGPLGSSEFAYWLEVRGGKADPKYLVPELEPILSSTQGLLCYQEQVMEIAKKLCGYGPGEASELRKAVGKKIQKLMDKHEVLFKKGWVENGLSKEVGNQLWTDINKHASYSFNRSHALSYGLITYQMAYLKAHYPIEFMCAVMTCEGGKQDDIIKCLAECKRLRIKVLPPDINQSKESFFINSNGEIRFGLGPVKNLGIKPVECLVEERNKYGAFEGLKDFCKRVDLGMVNRLKLESLIKAGAFDQFGDTRASKLAMVEKIWEYRKLMKAYDSKLGTYHRKLESCSQRLIDIEEGRSSATGKKLMPLKEPTRPEEPDFPETLEVEELTEQEIQEAEHELLGFYVTSHPLDKLIGIKFSKKLTSIEEVKKTPSGAKVSILVVIANKKEMTTKGKNKMAFVSLEDLTGSINGVCFPSVYERVKEFLEETRPLCIDAVVDVTETDKGRVTKLVIKNIQIVDLEIQTRSEKIDAVVPALRAGKLTELLEKYKGNIYEVRVSLELQDGTRVRFIGNQKINKYKKEFLKDLEKIQNE